MVRRMVGVALGVAALVFALSGARADEEKKAHAPHMHHEKCAKACAACMLECESCARHCADLVAKGKTKHVRTLRTCADCAEFCSAAARITARGGVMAVLMCEACAKACDRCGEACEKVDPDDAHMKKCAKACRDCAKECREMIKHAGHEGGAEGSKAKTS